MRLILAQGDPLRLLMRWFPTFARSAWSTRSSLGIPIYYRNSPSGDLLRLESAFTGSKRGEYFP